MAAVLGGKLRTSGSHQVVQAERNGAVVLCLTPVSSALQWLSFLLFFFLITLASVWTATLQLTPHLQQCCSVVLFLLFVQLVELSTGIRQLIYRLSVCVWGGGRQADRQTDIFNCPNVQILTTTRRVLAIVLIILHAGSCTCKEHIVKLKHSGNVMTMKKHKGFRHRSAIGWHLE